MKSKFIVFDYSERQIGHIKNIIKATHVSEVNGDDYLDIECLNPKIQKNYRILYHNRNYNTFHEFIVKDIEEYKNGNEIITRIVAENSIVETMGDFISERLLIGKTYLEMAEDFLLDTRWKITMSNDASKEKRTLKVKKMNVRASLNVISEQYDLELKTIIIWNSGAKKIDRFVTYEKKRGSFRGQRFTYNKNSTEIKRMILPDELITGIHAYGDEVEDPKTKEMIKTVATVTNDAARLLYGRLDTDRVTRKHIFSVKDYPGVKKREELLRKASRDLTAMSKPKISYEILVRDYVRILESGNSYIELGDEVRIIDRDFKPAIDIKSRIIRMEIDLIQFENTVLTINDVPTTLNDRLADGLDYEGFKDDSTDNLKENLRIGLSFWVDANEPSTVTTSGNKVISVKNAVTFYEDINEKNGSTFKRQALEQKDVSKAPSYTLENGRRWFTFEPDLLDFRSWKAFSPRPDGLYKDQYGQYISNVNRNDVINNVIIVFKDRIWERLNSTSGRYVVGMSNPLGNKWSTRSDFEGVEHVFGHVFNRTPVLRKRDTLMAVDISYNWDNNIPNKITDIGMNKESYSDYIYTQYGGVGINGIAAVELNTFFRGEIAEIIAYKRPLDYSERAVIKEYIINKYGISPENYHTRS